MFKPLKPGKKDVLAICYIVILKPLNPIYTSLRGDRKPMTSLMTHWFGKSPPSLFILISHINKVQGKKKKTKPRMNCLQSSEFSSSDDEQLPFCHKCACLSKLEQVCELEI